jgi:hypothetical protein
MTRRAIVEDCSLLSLHRVIREHRRGRRAPFVLAISLEPAHATLHVQVNGATQAVALTHEPHNFSGTRWWLLCACGHRAFTLYRPLAESEFRCRACHALSYRSENLSPASRLEHRAMKLARRIGGSLLRAPARPKGMHATTFARQSQRANAANARALAARLSRWSARATRNQLRHSPPRRARLSNTQASNET